VLFTLTSEIQSSSVCALGFSSDRVSLEFNVPYQHKYGYQRQIVQPKSATIYKKRATSRGNIVIIIIIIII